MMFLGDVERFALPARYDIQGRCEVWGQRILRSVAGITTSPQIADPTLFRRVRVDILASGFARIALLHIY